MARAHLSRVIQDAQGNLRPNAVVRVFDDLSNTLTEEPLFAAETGNATLANTFTVANGVVDFWTISAKRFRLGIKVGDEPEVVFEGVDSLSPDISGAAATSLGGHPASFFYSPDNPPPGSAGPGIYPAADGGTTVLDADDSVYFVTVADAEVTLPTPAGRLGKQYVIKSLVTVCTVVTSTGSIDGTTSRTLALYDSLTVISTGTNWGVV